MRKYNLTMLMLTVSLVMSLALLVVPKIASAAPPGCYNFNTSTGVFSSVACANPAMSAGVAAGNCFLSYTSGGGTTPLTGADCDSITLPPSPTPPPPSGAADEFGGFGQGIQKDDCNGAVIRAGGTGEEHCGILDILVTIINALSALVGVVIVAVLVVAGIQYSASADDPKAVAEAKNRIKNALVALASFIFMYAFLQWVVPGGVL